MLESVVRKVPQVLERHQILKGSLRCIKEWHVHVNVHDKPVYFVAAHD
jgi:hypothetical protein